MNLEKLYTEVSAKKEDSYYVELSKKEVLAVPLLIDIMLDDSTSNSRWAEKLLEKISAECPRIVYPYFQYILQMFEKSDSFSVWNVWKIISNLLVCDSENYWKDVHEKYLDALKSDQITEFSIACDCAYKVASSKPDETSCIVKILNDVGQRKFFIAGEVSKASTAVAIEKAEMFFKRIK